MRIRNYNFAIEIGSMDLIESYANKGNYFSALQIFHEMISNGVRPHSYHYNLLLRGFFRNNDFKGGMEFYKFIESHEIIPSKATYHTIIKALVDIKDVQQVREIYQKFIKHHKVPNLDTLNVFTSGLIKVGEVDEANNIVKNLSTFGLKPNLITYNNLMEGYNNSNSFTLNDIKQLYQRMLDENIEPNGITYRNLLLAYIKHGDLEGGLKVLEENFLANKIIHYHGAISLIRALINSGRDDAMEKCLNVYEKLKIRGDIKESLFNSMLYGAKKFGDMEIYNKISQEMNKMNNTNG